MSAKDANARKNEQILMELVKNEANKHCADCGQKGTRWASWNLGIFLCIRCGGLHRRLGTHISRVKSINLDKWTDEQIENMVNNGNAKVNATYNPQPDRFPFPSYSGDMEQYIRDKYERRLFMSPEAAASINATLSAHSSRNTGSGGSSFIGHANSPVAVAAMRYPLQMKSLQDMGFTEVAANQEALISTAGNLQQAIEALLSGSASRLQVSSPPTRNGSRERVDTVARGATINAVSKKTSVVDDLAGIFGAPPPPPITSKMTSSSPSGSAPTVVTSSSRHPPTSIMDMDLPVPNQEDGVSEEYEDFESAAHPKDSDGKTFLEASARRTAIFENGFADETPHVSGIPATSNAAGITESAITESRPSIADTSLGSNPWAKSADSTSVGREATGEAFDDIDPFRGYIPPTTSNKK